MSLQICTNTVKVLQKWEKDVTNDQTGRTTTYYSAKVADVSTYDNQVISLTKELYDQIKEGGSYSLYGEYGGLKSKYVNFKNCKAAK